MKDEKMQIGVIGSRKPSKRCLKIAYLVGKEIAKRGGILICGGLEGVMEEVCKGAKENGGLTIGILPGDSSKEANKYVDIRIVSGMGWARNQIVALSGDGIIMIGGEAGTLSEACIGWICEKPIVAIKGSGGYASFFAGKRLDKKRQDKIYEAKNAKEAVKLIFELCKIRRCENDSEYKPKGNAKDDA